MKLLDNIGYKSTSWRSTPRLNVYGLSIHDIKIDFFKLKHDSEYVPLSSLYSINNSLIKGKNYITLRDMFRFSQEEVKDLVYNFIFTPVKYINKNTSGYCRSYRTFVETAAYKWFFNIFDYNYTGGIMGENKHLRISNGLIIYNPPVEESFFINNCLGVEKYYSHDNNFISSSRVIVGLMIKRDYLHQYRFNLIKEYIEKLDKNNKTSFNISDIELDYSKVKLFIAPEIDKKCKIKGLNKFVTRSIIPVIESTGIEIIYESPEKFISENPGKEYNTDKLNETFEKYPQTVELFIKELQNIASNLSVISDSHINKFNAMLNTSNN